MRLSATETCQIRGALVSSEDLLKISPDIFEGRLRSALELSTITAPRTERPRQRTQNLTEQGRPTQYSLFPRWEDIMSSFEAYPSFADFVASALSFRSIAVSVALAQETCSTFKASFSSYRQNS